uniref:Uncharacterized protein n=1 Tax=Rhodnius prolixus TaxID=13249 RepID=T1I2I8_RHOPR
MGELYVWVFYLFILLASVNISSTPLLLLFRFPLKEVGKDKKKNLKLNIDVYSRTPRLRFSFAKNIKDTTGSHVGFADG